MKRLLVITVLLAAITVATEAQDTIVTYQGKSYLARVTKVEKHQIMYTTYPEADGKEYAMDVRGLREIRFYDGRHINYSDSSVVSSQGMSVYVDPVRMRSPSYYLKQSASCQFGVIGTSAAAGLFSALAATTPFNPARDPASAYILYGASAVCGIAALVLEILSISNLKKAGTSLERIHIVQNGVALDL